MINGKKHGRPCFYAFKDSRNPDIYWLVPVSSNIAKYKELHEYKTKRYGRCDTIHFGNIKGKECAFLIQNLCPVTEKYIESKYTIQDKTIKIDYALQNTLIKSSRRVLSITEKGAIKGLVFPNIKKIKKELIKQLEQEKKQQVQSAEQEKPKPIRRGGRVAPMQFPPSTRQPLAPIKRKTVKPKQAAAENVQEMQPRPKTKRKLVLEPKPNTDDRYRGR